MKLAPPRWYVGLAGAAIAVGMAVVLVLRSVLALLLAQAVGALTEVSSRLGGERHG